MVYVKPKRDAGTTLPAISWGPEPHVQMSETRTCGNLVGAHMPFKVHKLFDFLAIADHRPNDCGGQMTVWLWQEAGSTGGS